MTTLIQQRSPSDCVLAAMAMALGFTAWEHAWTEEDLQKVVESKGISDFDPWLSRHGLKAREDYFEFHVWDQAVRQVRCMLWRRRALLSVDSLNLDGGSHMIYWDGTRIWDPNEGKEGKLAFRHLSSCHISNVVLFAT
jgi:hypothetical protein